ncbi:MAG: flagellar basal body rod C-terminal domain-containing protein [Planctomycetaceae bacterium]
MSGVSLDEEAIRILELQHGYTAAARIISAIEEMFNTLVNM